MPGLDKTKAVKPTSNMAMVYYYDNTGKIKMCPIETGLTDGKNTEIINTRDLKAGTKIITGSDDATTITTTKKTTTNSFGGQNGPPPPMM